MTSLPNESTQDKPRKRPSVRSKRIPLFCCQECGKLFYSVGTAERASYDGCPGCNGLDIDIYIGKAVSR